MNFSENHAEILVAVTKTQREGGGGRILLGDDTGDHAAADQLPVCLNLDFEWAVLYVYIHTYIVGHYVPQCRLAKNSNCTGYSGTQLLR
jgi:hypothetical protein